MKSLSEVEKLVGLKRRAIQEYEDKGLAIKPTHKNKYGYLLYDTTEIERLWQLKFYKELGYNMTQIENLQTKGKKAETEELSEVIEALKEKREKLDQLIAIAEMMNDTGWSFNDLRSEMVESDELCSDDLFSLLGESLNLEELENVQDGVVEDIISEDDWEEIASYLGRIFEYNDENVDCNNKKVQSEIMNIQKVIAKSMSESLFLFQMMVKGIADNDDLNEEFGEEHTGYLRNALQIFCEEHKANPTDKSLIDSFNELEKLGRSRHTTGCKEVQNEVHNIYQFFI